MYKNTVSYSLNMSTTLFLLEHYPDKSVLKLEDIDLSEDLLEDLSYCQMYIEAKKDDDTSVSLDLNKASADFLEMYFSNIDDLKDEEVKLHQELLEDLSYCQMYLDAVREERRL